MKISTFLCKLSKLFCSCRNKVFPFVEKGRYKLREKPGNFLALLKDYAQTDKVLFDHLNSPRLKNSMHLSPTTQNEITSIIGFDFILGKIIGEVKKAKYFSLLADEICSHNVEHLALYLDTLIKTATLEKTL